MSMASIVQMLLNGLQLASVYMLIALGFTLIFGILHIVNMAQGSVYMVGGYSIWILFAFLKLNFFLSLILTIVFVGTLGVLMERFIFRRLKDLVMPTVIVSLGLMQVLEQLAVIVFGINERTVPNPFPGMLSFGGVFFPVQRLSIMMIAIVLTLALVVWIQKSRIGLGLRAVAQDRETASLYGVSYPRLGTLAFAVGFGLSGAAGALVAPLYFVAPNMGLQPLTKIFTIVIVGGLGSLPGAIVAGLVLGLIDSFVATLVNSVVASMIGFAMIIVVLLIRPTGLMGHE
jgi:branched-chain amino acid transport system permease protein